MKCCCCDKTLSDYESTLKHRTEGYYLDMCVKCLKGLSIPSVGRDDLLGKQEGAEEDSNIIYDEHFNDEAIGISNSDLGPMFYEEE